jgi:hypothetical protein
MADTSPTSNSPSPAGKVAAWFDGAVAWLKVRYMAFIAGGAGGYFMPKVSTILNWLGF